MIEISKLISRIASRHVYIQFLAAAVITLLSLILFGGNFALSIFFGAMTCIIPNLYFAKRFCRQTGAQNARNILFDLYKAEVFKLLLTGGMFLLIFTFIPVTITPIFVGFICTQAAFWVSISILKAEKATL